MVEVETPPIVKEAGPTDDFASNESSSYVVQAELERNKAEDIDELKDQSASLSPEEVEQARLREKEAADRMAEARRDSAIKALVDYSSSHGSVCGIKNSIEYKLRNLERTDGGDITGELLVPAFAGIWLFETKWEGAPRSPGSSGNANPVDEILSFRVGERILGSKSRMPFELRLRWSHVEQSFSPRDASDRDRFSLEQEFQAELAGNFEKRIAPWGNRKTEGEALFVFAGNLVDAASGEVLAQGLAYQKIQPIQGLEGAFVTESGRIVYPGKVGSSHNDLSLPDGVNVLHYEGNKAVWLKEADIWLGTLSVRDGTYSVTDPVRLTDVGAFDSRNIRVLGFSSEAIHIAQRGADPSKQLLSIDFKSRELREAPLPEAVRDRVGRRIDHRHYAGVENGKGYVFDLETEDSREFPINNPRQRMPEDTHRIHENIFYFGQSNVPEVIDPVAGVGYSLLERAPDLFVSKNAGHQFSCSSADGRRFLVTFHNEVLRHREVAVVDTASGKLLDRFLEPKGVRRFGLTNDGWILWGIENGSATEIGLWGKAPEVREAKKLASGRVKDLMPVDAVKSIAYEVQRESGTRLFIVRMSDGSTVDLGDVSGSRFVRLYQPSAVLTEEGVLTIRNASEDWANSLLGGKSLPVAAPAKSVASAETVDVGEKIAEIVAKEFKPFIERQDLCLDKEKTVALITERVFGDVAVSYVDQRIGEIIKASKAFGESASFDDIYERRNEPGALDLLNANAKIFFAQYCELREEKDRLQFGKRENEPWSREIELWVQARAKRAHDAGSFSQWLGKGEINKIYDKDKLEAYFQVMALSYAQGGLIPIKPEQVPEFLKFFTDEMVKARLASDEFLNRGDTRAVTKVLTEWRKRK